MVKQDQFLSCELEPLFTQDVMGVLKTIIGCMYCGIVITKTDKEGFVVWNQRAKEIIGKGAEEIPAEKWAEFYGFYESENGSPFQKENLPLVRALSGEDVCGCLMFIKNEIQSGAWIDVTASAIKDKNGCVIGAVAVFQNVTQNKLMEKQLQHASNDVKLLIAEQTKLLELLSKQVS